MGDRRARRLARLEAILRPSQAVLAFVDVDTLGLPLEVRKALLEALRAVLGDRIPGVPRQATLGQLQPHLAQALFLNCASAIQSQPQLLGFSQPNLLTHNHNSGDNDDTVSIQK